MICLYSAQSPFAVGVYFRSVSNPFYIRSMSAINLYVAVYDFYSLLKSAHAGQQFVCGRKNDSDNLATLIPIVLALASNVSLNHTLCLHAFLLLFFRLCCSTVHQVMALALELTDIHTYRLHAQADRC